MDPEGRKYPKSELLVAEYIRQGMRQLWSYARPNLHLTETHITPPHPPYILSPSSSSPPFLYPRWQPQAARCFRAPPSYSTAHWPLIPIEQSNLHKLYTNRMKILIMASNTRERHPSGELHPPVPRSPCTCRVSKTGCLRYHEHRLGLHRRSSTQSFRHVPVNSPFCLPLL